MKTLLFEEEIIYWISNKHAIIYALWNFSYRCSNFLSDFSPHYVIHN